jgi:hypothetical protein
MYVTLSQTPSPDFSHSYYCDGPMAGPDRLSLRHKASHDAHLNRLVTNGREECGLRSVFLGFVYQSIQVGDLQMPA